MTSSVALLLVKPLAEGTTAIVRVSSWLGLSFPVTTTVLVESGLPDYVVTSWNGLSSRAGTPDPIVRKLNKLVVTALEDPVLQEKAQRLGIEAHGSTPEAMRERMARDIARWRGVIEKANLASTE